MKAEFRAAARRELMAAADWYLQDGGPAVAEQFEHAVQRALRLLSAMPTLGTPKDASVRLWPLRRFPYTLVYRLNGDVLAVIAVAHQSREPEYWQGR